MMYGRNLFVVTKLIFQIDSSFLFQMLNKFHMILFDSIGNSSKICLIAISCLDFPHVITVKSLNDKTNEQTK